MPNAPTGNKRGTIIRQKPLPEQLKQQLVKSTDQFLKLAKDATRHFRGLDRTTKKKIVAGLSGVLALLALRAHHRSAKRRREKKS